MLSTFTLASLAGTAAVAAVAGAVRGRPYAIFSSVILGLHTAISSALAPHTGVFFIPYAILQGTVFVHFLSLIKPAMRPAWYRTFVSVPASWFSASTLLAFPWAIAAGVGVSPWGFFIPYVLGAMGVAESLFSRDELIDIALDGTTVPALGRHRSPEFRAERPLRVVQITDPHLGPFMSEARLRKICERAVARDPDVILLTGDFLTMESQSDPAVLTRALSPLQAMKGRTFACMGNHDHEVPRIVKGALGANGVALLIDDCTTVETAVGPVEIMGYDFVWRDRENHYARVTSAYPRTEGVPRLAMLHDPGAFKHLPEGSADLVFSGHTHGGHLGLLRFGLPHTIVSAMTKMPDHGLWAKGGDRLYVHRGTGHYGFPIRLGVPSEEGEIRVHFAPRTA